MHMFHFLRPEWLWGLLPLFGLLLLLARRGTTAQVWEPVCDAHLLPHLLVGTEGARRRMPLVLLGLGWALAVCALAGPVWSQLPQPVYRAESALVIILDLSRSMDVQDVAPSRLTRAKHKILDILESRKEGQTALVVFAGEAFVVSPLTDDARTMVTLVQSLETELMPLQGSRADLALRKARELLERIGHGSGDLLLLTDGEGDPATLKVVEELRHQGRRVSVLGVGTVDGAPIPESGGFLKNQDGAIAIPKLNIPSLQALARAGGGRYATVTFDDRDIDRVLPAGGAPEAFSSSTSEQRTTDLWREEGPWLVLLILPVALLAFRPGWLGMMLIFMLIPQVSDASSWEKLWSRPDQQGYRALERGAPEEAAGLFEDPGWKGIAQYRAGNFQEAEKAFSAMNTPEGHYNRGNALANLGHYEEALASYQAALTQQPQHEDARHNMEVIKKLMENSSPPNQEGQQPSPSEPSSSIQKNDGRDDDGEGGEPAQASDSTPGRHSRPSKDGSEGNQEEMEPRTGSKSGQSANPTRSDKDASPSGENVAEETSKLEPSKGEQSEKSMPSASSPEEQPGDEAEKSEVASAASTAEASDMQKSDQALRQWLRRIPDDPGGLLRRKFLLEHQRRIESGRSTPSQGRSW